VSVEIALIAAGSAVGGSLITGGLAYLGMRHQSNHDRRIRLMEARRTAYARLLAVAFDTVNVLSTQRVPWRLERFLHHLRLLQRRATGAIGEVRILATEDVRDAAGVLMASVLGAAEFAFGVLGQAAKAPPVMRLFRPNAPGLAEVIERLGDASTQFVAAIKAELKIP
jgi:hypothetical protein